MIKSKRKRKEKKKRSGLSSLSKIYTLDGMYDSY